MSIMTEDQVKLLHKLQMAEIPAFKNINPLTLQEDEARDLFRMNLPQLEWINAAAQNENHELVEKRFIGVSENNCREQMKEWLEKENLASAAESAVRRGGSMAGIFFSTAQVCQFQSIERSF